MYCAMYTMRFCHLICMYVFQAIRTCGFWNEHNTLFNSKRLAKINSFDTILYMYVAVLLVFDRISLIKLDNRISYYRHTCDISRYQRIPPISRALICPLPDGPPICLVSRHDKKSIYVLYFTLFFIQVSISLCKV